MLWDKHGPLRNTPLQSKVAFAVFFTCAAIAVFFVGFLASRLLNGPRTSRPRQVANAAAPAIPQVPIQKVSQPQPETPLTPSSAPLSAPPSDTPDSHYPNESEAEEIRIAIRPGTSASNRPTTNRTASSPPAYNPAPFNPAPFNPAATTVPPQPLDESPIASPPPEKPKSVPLVKELPALGAKDDFTLHTFPELLSQEATFSLDTSAAAAPKGMTLVVQKSKDANEPTWQVSLEPLPKSEPNASPEPKSDTPPSTVPASAPVESQSIGQFRLVNGELRYRWLAATPEAAQVANCVVQVRWGDKQQKVLLRRPQRTQNLILSLSKLPPVLTTGVEVAPKSESIEFVLDELEGFDDTVAVSPETGKARVGSRLRIKPKHSLNLEFDISILVRSDGLALQPKPSFLLSENNRQEFTTDKLESVKAVTAARIQKDLNRLAFAQSRVRDIPYEIRRLNGLDLQPAVKGAALTALQREAKSSEGTIKSLTTSIPRSQEVANQLDLYHKLAQSLDGRLKLRGKLIAVADTAEIPLWIAE